MDATQVLISAGTVLLSVSALLGFVQERHRGQPESFAAWRVVHAGGTAGAVQLLALAAVWDRLAGAGAVSMMLACTLSVVAWAFFVGPLARALGWPRLARLVNTVGAALAIPGYVALALTLGSVVAIAAQSEPAFDVVSIKRNVSGAFPVGPEARRGGSFVAINATLERIVRFAYDLPDYRVVGGAEWVRRDRFDVEARTNRDAPAGEIRRMVQTLMTNRFQLVVRREQRDSTIYALLMARNDKKLGPNLRPSAADCAKTAGPGGTIKERRTPNGGVSTQRTCASMAVLVSILADALQSPVDDKTGLAGQWDFELSYTGERRRNTTAAAAAQDPNDAPALLTALQEQLGLKLESGRGSVEFLVIESAAQPTEN